MWDSSLRLLFGVRSRGIFNCVFADPADSSIERSHEEIQVEETLVLISCTARQAFSGTKSTSRTAPAHR
jgi:hypothetical protein